ncbi:hypothetical protein RhiirA5_354620, partial [Rhizophagus irregularis]
MSYDCRMLATGNQAGKIYLWDVQEDCVDYYIEKKRLEYQEIKNDKTFEKKKKSNKKTNKKTNKNNETNI